MTSPYHERNIGHTRAARGESTPPSTTQPSLDQIPSPVSSSQQISSPQGRSSQFNLPLRPSPPSMDLSFSRRDRVPTTPSEGIPFPEDNPSPFNAIFLPSNELIMGSPETPAGIVPAGAQIAMQGRLAVVRTDTLSPQEAATPRDLIPSGHHMEEQGGLIVVTAQVEVYTAEDLPQHPTMQDRQDGPVPQNLVHPLIWGSSLDTATSKLAQETDNSTAVGLLEAERELRTSLTNFRESEILNKLNSEGIKKVIQASKILKIQKLQSATEASPTSIQSDMDRFFAATIDELNLLTPTEQRTHPQVDGELSLQDRIMLRLTNVADMVRYQTRTIQIKADKTMEMIAQLPEIMFTSHMLEFLTRFEIPPSLGGELLPKLEKIGKLQHPLAWYLLDNLPSEHPFKELQRRRVSQLVELLSGEITPPMLQMAQKLSEGIVSVYVDPDSDPEKDRVGLEIENFSAFNGVPVPPGTTQGQNGNHIKGIPELRLDNDDAILMYGKAWRHRYYLIHLWTQLADVAPASLHIHVNRTNATNVDLFKLLFGYEEQQVKENFEHDTIEIKGTALYGFDERIKDAKGFSTEFMPGLVELIYSLRILQPTPIGEDVLKGDRFTLFSSVVKDPFARAAMFMALQTEAGLRVRDPKRLADPAILNDPDINLLIELSSDRNIILFDEGLQGKLLSDALKKSNEHDNMYLIHSFGNNFSLLSEPLKNMIFSWGIQSQSMWVIFPLSQQMSAISDAKKQEQLINVAYNISHVFGLSDPLGFIATNYSQLEESAREYFLRRALISGNESVLSELGKVIAVFRDTPEKQQQILNTAILSNNIDALYEIGKSYKDLAEPIKRNFLQWLKRDKVPLAMLAIAEVLPAISSAETQREIIDLVIASPSHENCIEAIGGNYPFLKPSAQAYFYYWVTKTKDTNALQGMTQAVYFVSDPEKQRQIVNLVIKAGDGPALKNLSKDISSLPNNLQADIITAAFASDSLDILSSFAANYTFFADTAKKLFFSRAIQDFPHLLLQNLHGIDDAEKRRQVVATILENDENSRENLPALVRAVELSLIDDPKLVQRIVQFAIEPIKTNNNNQEGANTSSLSYDEKSIFNIAKSIRSLDPTSRVLLLSFIKDKFPVCYKATISNIGEWQYK